MNGLYHPGRPRRTKKQNKASAVDFRLWEAEAKVMADALEPAPINDKSENAPSVQEDPAPALRSNDADRRKLWISFCSKRTLHRIHLGSLEVVMTCAKMTPKSSCLALGYSNTHHTREEYLILLSLCDILTYLIVLRLDTTWILPLAALGAIRPLQSLHSSTVTSTRLQST